MKIVRLLLTAALLAGPRLHAAENRYDVLSKLLVPFIGVLAKNTKNPNRAMTLTGRLERLTGLPPELKDVRAELSLQFPDRLLVRGPILGENVAVCRDRQQIWAVPGAKVKELLERATTDRKPEKQDADATLGPLELPLPEKQLVFLPALFLVKDAGVEAMDGTECRVLDLELMPQLAQSLKEKWAARVWVDAQYRPVRLVLTRPGWELAVRFEKVEFVPQLPEATWKAGEDALRLDAAQFRQLMRSIIPAR